MVTIIKGEDRRKVTKGAFETYFKGIGYEIEKKKTSKPIEKISDTEDKEVEQAGQKPAQQTTYDKNYNNKSIGNNKNKKQED